MLRLVPYSICAYQRNLSSNVYDIGPGLWYMYMYIMESTSKGISHQTCIKVYHKKVVISSQHSTDCRGGTQRDFSMTNFTICIILGQFLTSFQSVYLHSGDFVFFSMLCIVCSAYLHWRHPATILEVKRWQKNHYTQICTQGALVWSMIGRFSTSRWGRPTDMTSCA